MGLIISLHLWVLKVLLGQKSVQDAAQKNASGLIVPLYFTQGGILEKAGDTWREQPLPDCGRHEYKIISDDSSRKPSSYGRNSGVRACFKLKVRVEVSWSTWNWPESVRDVKRRNNGVHDSANVETFFYILHLLRRNKSEQGADCDTPRDSLCLAPCLSTTDPALQARLWTVTCR